MSAQPDCQSLPSSLPKWCVMMPLAKSYRTRTLRRFGFGPARATLQIRPDFQYGMNGTLALHPLAELIREIASKYLSGALRLEQDRARVVVYFEKGAVVFAASNIRTLRLREYLKTRELISDQEFEALKNPGADLRLGESLVAGGKLKPKDFDSLVATLVGDTLRVPLLWTEGTWEFDSRARLADPVRASIDASSL